MQSLSGLRIDNTKQKCYNYTDRQREIKWTRLSERIFYIDNKITAIEKKKAVQTMQEMNEQYKGCPVQVNTYEVDGTQCIVTSHFVGNKNINDVIMKYAEDRAMSELLGSVPSVVTT